MDKKKLNAIKDKIYECEGLLELLHLRADKEDDLLPMIVERIDAARDLLTDASEEIAAEKTSPLEDVPAEEQQSVSETEPNGVSDHIEEFKNITPAFCLNDRFRFRRALFGGSDSEFNAVMDHLATLSSFDDAEDYFYGELGFDPEDEVVMDFMEIIKNYFDR